MNTRHQRFVEEYVRDRNATAAYKRAGFRATGHLGTSLPISYSQNAVDSGTTHPDHDTPVYGRY